MVEECPGVIVESTFKKNRSRNSKDSEDEQATFHDIEGNIYEG